MIQGKYEVTAIYPNPGAPGMVIQKRVLSHEERVAWEEDLIRAHGVDVTITSDRATARSWD